MLQWREQIKGSWSAQCGLAEEEDGCVLLAPAEERSTLQTAEVGIPDYTMENPPAVKTDGNTKLLLREDKHQVGGVFRGIHTIRLPSDQIAFYYI